MDITFDQLLADLKKNNVSIEELSFDEMYKRLGTDPNASIEVASRHNAKYLIGGTMKSEFSSDVPIIHAYGKFIPKFRRIRRLFDLSKPVLYTVLQSPQVE